MYTFYICISVDIYIFMYTCIFIYIYIYNKKKQLSSPNAFLLHLFAQLDTEHHMMSGCSPCSFTQGTDTLIEWEKEDCRHRCVVFVLVVLVWCACTSMHKRDGQPTEQCPLPVRWDDFLTCVLRSTHRQPTEWLRSVLCAHSGKECSLNC